MSTMRASIRKACIFIFACEVAERVGYYAISSNLTIYWTSVLHENVAVAARNVNNWGGTTFLTPFIGAFVADAFLGRYWTIVMSSCTYFVALVFLTLSMSLPSLKPPACDQSRTLTTCSKETSAQSGFFYFSLYLMALGAGGIKSCVTAFAGDQFDEGDAEHKQLKISFMNWWWLSLSIGIMLSVGIFPWVQQYLGWFWVAAIPAIIAGFVASCFIFGRPFFKHHAPSGSAFTRIMQVIVAALKNRNMVIKENTILFQDPYPGAYKLAHTDTLRFLDKAAIVNGNSSQTSLWSVCSITQVEEVKLLIHVLPVWTSNIMNSAVFAQVGTLFTNQGTTMNRSLGPHFTVPPASLAVFISLTICIFLPLYDRYLVPFARRFTGHDRGFSVLQRIGIGLAISTLAMAIAALVEMKRLKIAKDHGLLDTPSVGLPMSVFWLLPQYCIVGLYEVFLVVGQNEFFYQQVPHSMRSIGTALFFNNVAIGSFFSSALVSVVNKVTQKSNSVDGWIGNNLNRSHLDYFYWLLTLLSFIFFLFFLVCAHLFKYKDMQEPQSPEIEL